MSSAAATPSVSGSESAPRLEVGQLASDLFRRWRLPPAVGGVLRTYAAVGFSSSPLVGLIFFAATCVVPEHGMAGLLGLLAANGWARLLGRPIAHRVEGYYGLSGLLTGLAMGLWYRLTWPLVGFILAASLLVVLVAAVVRTIAERQLGVPAMCLPFVLVSWLALLAAPRFAEIEYSVATVEAAAVGATWVPAWSQGFLRALAACFFQLGPAAGLLLFAGLVLSSRWSALLAIGGYSVGITFYGWLGGLPTDHSLHLVGFNYILTAIALGGIFVVLSPASIALALAACGTVAVVSAAFISLLAQFGLPVLAFPFLLVTQLTLLVLVQRVGQGGPVLVVGAPATPEQNARRVLNRARRYPDPSLPVVFLPVMGRWVVTQGPDGPHTHQGPWAHAWDFEVCDADGRFHQGEGLVPDDYLAWGAPVVAAADGQVVRVIDHVEDNLIGEVNTVDNWGNLVLIWHQNASGYGGVYSLVCHLQKGTATVVEGQRVVRGQPVGRVGNSGRSPVPHLHFHLQATPEIGAPTVRGALLHYVTGRFSDGSRSDAESPGGNSGGAREYVTWGCPDEGDVVEALTPDARVRDALLLSPGRTFEWRVDEGGRQWSETWESTIDPLGGRALVSRGDRGAGRAGLYSDANYTTVLDYEGSGGLLSLFAIAGARVPFAGGEVSWRDRPSAAGRLPLPVRWAADLALPLTDLTSVPTRSRVELAGPWLVLRTDVTSVLPAAWRWGSTVPERVEVVCHSGNGPVRIEAFIGSERVLCAEVTS